MTMGKFKTLQWTDRIKMEALLNAGHSKREVAKQLHVHRSTIYREFNRGKYVHRNSDYTESERYSSDLGQKIHNWCAQGKGRNLKIGKDRALLEYIEEQVIENKCSLEAALFMAKEATQEGKKSFHAFVSLRTLYRYVDSGLTLRLTNKELPVKGKRRKNNKRIRVQKRANAGVSIDKRPEEVEHRNQFGHWEMDTVKGKRGVTKGCLLVLSERKTREEIIIRLKDQTAKSVVSALDSLEQQWGELFYKIFQTITVDNGTEFADFRGMEQSFLKEGKRTQVYYCHAYCSWERGTNENTNRLIRRHIPKGEDLDERTEEEISKIEIWINQYPRRIFGYKRAATLFQEELSALI